MIEPLPKELKYVSVVMVYIQCTLLYLTRTHYSLIVVCSFPATTASGRERPRSMETIHKLRGRTGAIGNTVTKLFKRKHYKRKSKELKQPVTITDGGMYVVCGCTIGVFDWAVE